MLHFEFAYYFFSLIYHGIESFIRYFSFLENHTRFQTNVG